MCSLDKFSVIHVPFSVVFSEIKITNKEPFIATSEWQKVKKGMLALTKSHCFAMSSKALNFFIATQIAQVVQLDRFNSIGWATWAVWSAVIEIAYSLSR